MKYLGNIKKYISKFKYCSFVIYLSYVVILIILISFTPIIDKINIQYSLDSGRYFFSAILQGNAAILSILGVFTIFKIQALHSNIDTLKASRLGDMGSSSTPTGIIEFDKKSLEEKEIFVKNFNTSPMIKGVYESWLENEIIIDNILKNVKIPIILLIISILLNALLIILIDSVFILNTESIIQLYIFCIYYEFVILLELTKNIFNLIKYKNE